MSHDTVVIGSYLDSIYRKLTPQQWEDLTSRLGLTEVKIQDMRPAGGSAAQSAPPAIG